MGGAWGDVEVKNNSPGVNPGPFDYDLDASFFGGGTAGYNWQHQSILIGIEGGSATSIPRARGASLGRAVSQLSSADAG